MALFFSKNQHEMCLCSYYHVSFAYFGFEDLSGSLLAMPRPGEQTSVVLESKQLTQVSLSFCFIKLSSAGFRTCLISGFVTQQMSSSQQPLETGACNLEVCERAVFARAVLSESEGTRADVTRGCPLLLLVYVLFSHQHYFITPLQSLGNKVKTAS